MRRTPPPFQPLSADTSVPSPVAHRAVSFPPRGNNVSRLEGFSDAVFGFALTILVVSLNAPQTFGELQKTVRGAVPFALCFAFLVLIWYKHYRFFRDYGLEDARTVVLNAMLLFTVLFYVYPLRLLFHLWWLAFNTDQAGITRMVGSWREATEVFALFGIGFAAVMLIFALLYAHALTKRTDLGLTPVEVASARVTVTMNLLCSGIGVASVLLALLLPLRQAMLSAWVYTLVIPLVLILEPYLRRRARRV